MVAIFSASGLRVQRPCGPRKSGMPESVEMPAPVSATIRRAASIQPRTVARARSRSSATTIWISRHSREDSGAISVPPPIVLNTELLHGRLALRLRLRGLAGLVQFLRLRRQLPRVVRGVVESVSRLVVDLLDELRTLGRPGRSSNGDGQDEDDGDHKCDTPHRCDSFPPVMKLLRESRYHR